jgi:PTS system fructose-specific IIA component/PTS system nitrogen regulatory IIA component
VAAILDREDLGSTGIGRGLAIPHTKHPSVQNTVGIVGHAPDGIDFDSLDGRPVRNVVLLISPPDQTQQHLRAMQQIVRIYRESPTNGP